MTTTQLTTHIHQLGETEEILSNEATTADIDWLRIANYGDHPHRTGLQRLTKDAAAAMADSFNSLKRKLLRRFRGCPIYIGHPDDNTFAGTPGHTDTRAYGWVEELAAREDGLWLRAKWSEAGQRLLENAHYRFFSPRWAVTTIGQRLFQPVQLVSLGLTNHPNIAGDAIANASLAEPPFYRQACDLQDQLQDIRSREEGLAEEVARLREERIELTVANAELRGVITTAECASWSDQLRQDFQQASSTLANQRPRLKVSATTTNLRPDQQNGNHRNTILATHARMQLTGEDFATAWSNVKRLA